MIVRSLCLLVLLAGCEVVPVTSTGPAPAPTAAEVTRSSKAATNSFRRSVRRIEPIAERRCRAKNPDFRARSCDFRFAISNDPKLGRNAFQSIGRDGRPQVTFTLALLRVMRNDDEVAFVLAHEAGHQISRHLQKASAQQQLGAALLGGLLAASGNASEQSVRQAAGLGAFLGRRAYSKKFEFEADRQAVFISMEAGYDPLKGAQPFTRVETGTRQFLGTHPPSSDRLRRIQRAIAEARR